LGLTNLFHPNGGHQNCGQIFRDADSIYALEEHIELYPFAALQRRASQLME